MIVLLCGYNFVAADVHIFVNPQGSDNNDGLTVNTPVRSLSKALLLGNIARRDVNCAIYIELMQGYHDLDNTLQIPYRNVVLRAYQSQEVHVTGGRRIPSNWFKHVTDVNVPSRLSNGSLQSVRVVHLPDLNITDYGKMGQYGYTHNRVAPLEVFYNSKPLHLARWPDIGFVNIVGVPSDQHGLKFQYNSSRPSGWKSEPEPWVYGYWYWGWADEALPVANIDAHNGIVTLATESIFGLRIGHYNYPDAGWSQQGGYFRFINILSELDNPSEYYIDRVHGDLYVWMPNADGNIQPSDVVYVSLIDNCIRLNDGLKDVRLEGFTLEACRAGGISGNNVQNVEIVSMDIRNTGGPSVSFSGDNRNIIVSKCLIHDGDGGVFVSGGNRTMLESSGNVIEYNEIYSYAREGASGRHAVSIRGVNNIVRYNHIYNGQYIAIYYYGNDNRMEFNHIHHVCVNASDCGAFYTGLDWTTRGNIIRYNIVHHTLRLVPGMHCRGVMLDDQSSSTLVSNNVFYDNSVHVNIGAGRDNIVANNIMYNATFASLEVDGRGIYHQLDKDLFPRLHAMPYAGTLWASRYPKLATIDSHNASLPEGNQVTKNIVFIDIPREFIHGLIGWLDNPVYYNVSQTRGL